MVQLNKYTRYILIGLVLCFGIALYILSKDHTELKQDTREILGDEPKLYLYTNGTESTGQMSVSVPFTHAVTNSLSIDVGLDINHDEQISDDEWQITRTPTFSVQNLRNNFWLSDTDKKISVGDTVLLSIRLQVDNDSEIHSLDKRIVVEAFDADTLLGFDVDGAHEDLKRGIGIPNLSAQTAYAEEPKAKDEPVFRNGITPDLAQGPMECAAVSAANSLMSLAGEHDQLTKLPAFTGELIEELKTDMKYSGKGISLANMMAGKNAFAQRHTLPIVTTVKLAPTKEDILSALRSGAAVEISFAFVQSKSGRDNTGHVVTLVGGSQSELYVHDSGTPEGMDTLRMYGTVQTPKTTYINVPYALWDGTAYIDGIVIQNWTEAVHAEESYTDAREQASEVEMLVINNHYFPKSLFRVGDHGECKSAHYHSVSDTGIVHGLKSKDATEIVSMTDPLPNSCGFGKVAEVPVEKITLTYEHQNNLFVFYQTRYICQLQLCVRNMYKLLSCNME